MDETQGGRLTSGRKKEMVTIKEQDSGGTLKIVPSRDIVNVPKRNSGGTLKIVPSRDIAIVPKRNSGKDLKKRRTSSSLTINDLELRRKRRGTRTTTVALQRWNFLKENLFVILMEMQSTEMRKEKAIKEANQYANDATGWDVTVKVESESEFASVKTEITEKSVKYLEESDHGRWRDGNCCGLRTRKVKEPNSEITRNIPVPNTHISCRSETFQNLFAIMQSDPITYEDCVREYYKPFQDSIGFIGTRKLHLFLWLAIGTHIFCFLAILIDIVGYWIIKDLTLTTQNFTSTLLLVHILCFMFSALSYIYVTQMGAVRGMLTGFCHVLALAAGIGMIIRALLEIMALDYRKEIFIL